MIPIIVTVITTLSFYSIAEKKGASKVKWVLIGFLVSILPLIFIPTIIILVTGRQDLDALALMASILIIMMLSTLLSKLIKGK